MKHSIITFALLLCLVSTTHAQEATDLALPELTIIGDDSEHELDPHSQRFRTRALIGGYSMATALYGYLTWWSKDVDRHKLQEDGTVITETLSNRSSQFNFRNEGWFGADTPNGGADKLGHAFSFYLSTRLLSKGLMWAGNERQSAARMAALTSGSVSLAVEIIDGFSEEYGFSYEDLVMNLVGIGSAMWLEAYPQWDDVIDLRFRYAPSPVAKQVGERDPVTDYSGQTYMLVLKASGIPVLRDNKFLRYLEFDIGYGSRGYQPTLGPFADTQTKERFVYYGISLNLSQILNDTIFRSGAYPKSQTITREVLEYIHIPGNDVLLKKRL
jgi:hypothetical protein